MRARHLGAGLGSFRLAPILIAGLLTFAGPLASPAAATSAASFSDGTYVVGSDIQPGTYRTRVGTSFCYWERVSGFGGTIDEVIANDITSGPAVVTISPSDKGFTSSGCGTWTSNLSPLLAPWSPIPEGTYFVGTDIQPGTYRTGTGLTGCYWERLSGFGGTFAELLANDYLDGSAIVTILPTDVGFTSRRCGTWTNVAAPPGATYHAIAPTRVLDTRDGTGGLAGPFTNHTARTFTVSGIPAGATAVTGNLTVTGQTSNGYLYIGPVANDNPTSSTLNFPLGDDRANAVTVQLGVGNTLSITFVAPRSGPTAQAIFDVTGYFTADTSGATYHPVTPARVLDTRDGTGGLSGPFTNHAARTFTVSGIPAGATAVTGNLTVTGQTSNGYLFIGPVANSNPTSSTLNFPVGDDRANAVAVQLGAGNTLSVTFVAPTDGPTAQAIFDVTGYFTSDMSGATYHPIAPTRSLDTRDGTGGLSGPFTNHAARTLTISGLPSTATAVTGNLTVTGQTSNGYLYVGPVSNNSPTSSTLNFPVGDDRANAVTVQLGGGNTLSVTFVAPRNGPSAQAIFDVTGYFTPGA